VKIKGPQACPKRLQPSFLDPSSHSSRKLTVCIAFHTKKFALVRHRSTIQKLAEMVVEGECLSSDEVSISFVGKRHMCELHRIYFHDPSPTDCISFPLDNEGASGYNVLGEVVIMPEVAWNWSKSHGGDFYHELSLYIIHGLLHLAGYDDQNPSAKKIMRSREKKYLRLAHKQGCILHA